MRLLGFVVSAMFAVAAAAQTPTPPGTVIVNQAVVEFIGSSGIDQVATSNEVSTVTAATRTPAQITILQPRGGAGSLNVPFAATTCTSSGQQLALSEPGLLNGTSITTDVPINVALADRHHGGEPLLIRLVDADRNVDSGARDTVEVIVRGAGTGDSETLQLRETAPDSGAFTGHVPTEIATAATAFDCVLQVGLNSRIDVSYVDPDDPTDTATSGCAGRSGITGFQCVYRCAC